MTTTTEYRITSHAAHQAAIKGWALREVYLACVDPDITYESRNHPGQMRHVRGNLVAIVDRARKICVTVYLNVERTALRPDQMRKVG